MNTQVDKKQRVVTPIYDNLFEIEFKSHKFDISLLSSMIAGYELKSSDKKLIVYLDVVEESLSTIFESFEKIDHVKILIHDIHGCVILAIGTDCKYIGLEMKQAYTSDGLLKIGVAFDIKNTWTKLVKEDDTEE